MQACGLAGPCDTTGLPSSEGRQPISQLVQLVRRDFGWGTPEGRRADQQGTSRLSGIGRA